MLNSKTFKILNTTLRLAHTRWAQSHTGLYMGRDRGGNWKTALLLPIQRCRLINHLPLEACGADSPSSTLSQRSWGRREHCLSPRYSWTHLREGPFACALGHICRWGHSPCLKKQQLLLSYIFYSYTCKHSDVCTCKHPDKILTLQTHFVVFVSNILSHVTD